MTIKATVIRIFKFMSPSRRQRARKHLRYWTWRDRAFARANHGRGVRKFKKNRRRFERILNQERKDRKPM